MKLASYNIRKAVGRDRRRDPGRVIEVINSLGADVVVLPSYFPEGLPRSLLEAMACGKAIVTTDTPGCRDVLVDGENGLLVRPRDTDSLVDAFRRLIEAPQEVERMGQASRKLLLERFSDEHVIGQTMTEYSRAGALV